MKMFPIVFLLTAILLVSCAKRPSASGGPAGSASSSKTAEPKKYEPSAEEKAEIEDIKKLIAEKKDLNALIKTSEREWIPLMRATIKGWLKAAELLVENGADPNKTYENGSPPLHLAALEGNTALFDLLLKHKADATRKAGSQELHLLHYAALGGSMDIVKKTLGATKAEIDVRSKNMLTPLHVAVQNGHLDIVTFLLEKGANLKAVGQEGLTVLHIAAYYDQPHLIELLLAKGLDVNIRNTAGRTPLHSAASGERIQYFKVTTEKKGQKPIVENIPDNNRRYKGSKTDSKEIDPDLLGKVYIETQQHREDPSGPWTTTMTYELAVYESVKAAKTLLARGADVNAKDNEGKTPLDRSLGNRYAHDRVAEVLKAHAQPKEQKK